MMQLVGKAVRKGIRKLGGTGQTKKADRVRQAAGKTATDLGTPAKSSGPGREADLRSGGPEIHEPTPGDASIARGVRVGQANIMQEAYNKKKKKLKVLEGKAEQLSKKASPGKKKTVMGRHMSNQKLKDVKDEIQRLETSMKDMVNRYNIEKKSGGKIIKRKGKPPLIESPVGPSKRKPKQQTPKLPKPPAGFKWEKVPKVRRTYRGWEATKREAKKGGQVKRISHKQTDGSKLVGSTYD